jgi:hypothetical protein
MLLRTIEVLIDAALARGETDITIEVRDDVVQLTSKRMES